MANICRHRFLLKMFAYRPTLSGHAIFMISNQAGQSNEPDTNIFH